MADILFENDALLAVNKPAGLAAIPEGVAGRENLLAQLEARFAQKLYIVHRLDKEVSGVILFAKHATAHRWFNEQFSSRQVKKQYLALAHGLIPSDNGVIDAPLREFGSGRVGVALERGKAALTAYTVLTRNTGYTLLHAYPQTGRRHQLRVHFYSIGHALVGDPRYGDRQVQQAHPRLLLHAQQITIGLPDNSTITVTAPPPADFQRTVAELVGAAHYPITQSPITHVP